MSPRPDVSVERKQQILEAALDVFARLGFQQSRMDDIAKQAGISKAAIYLYYPSKDAVVAALLRYFFTEELHRLQQLLKTMTEERVTDQLLELTRRLAESMQEMFKVMPISFEFYALAGRDPEVHQFLRDYYCTYRVSLAELLERGVRSGEFHALDIEVAATTLVGLFEGIALLSFVDQDQQQLGKQFEQSVRLLIASWGKPGEKEETA